MAQRLTSADVQIGYIPEATENVTPATPAFSLMRVTSENLKGSRELKQSTELTRNRNISDLVIASAQAEGSVAFEFIDGAFDDLMAIALWNDWSANVLVNGTVPKPHSIEVLYNATLLAEDVYKRMTGGYISQLSLEAKAGEILIGSMEFMGRGLTYGAAAIVGSTYVAAPTDAPMSATEFGSLIIGALSIDCISSLSVSINNNLRTQRCLGTVNPTGIGPGTFEVTGEIELFLTVDQLPMIQAFENNTPLALSWIFGTTTLKRTQFSLPRIKFSDIEVAAEGQNQDILVKAKWTGTADALGKTIEITRNVA